MCGFGFSFWAFSAVVTYLTCKHTSEEGQHSPPVITAQKESTLFSFLGAPCIPGIYRRAIEESKDHRD